MNVGTPHDSEFAGFLLREKPLSDADYVDLLAKVRADINPLLDKLSLDRLADIPMPVYVILSKVALPSGLLQVRDGEWKLGTDAAPFCDNGTRMLDEFGETQGIFFPKIQMEHMRPLTLRISVHGLTRAGVWMVADVAFREEIIGGPTRTSLKIIRINVRLFSSPEDFLQAMVHKYIDFRFQIVEMLDELRQQTLAAYERREQVQNELRTASERLRFYVSVLSNLSK